MPGRPKTICRTLGICNRTNIQEKAKKAREAYEKKKKQAETDNKVSIEEAVQTFESLGDLARQQYTLRPQKSQSMQPDYSCTFQAFLESIQLAEASPDASQVSPDVEISNPV